MYVSSPRTGKTVNDGHAGRRNKALRLPRPTHRGCLLQCFGSVARRSFGMSKGPWKELLRRCKCSREQTLLGMSIVG